MKIIKYNKISLNKYELTLEDKSKIKLYEDIIVKEELLLKKDIDVDYILKLNSKYELYDKCLNYISIKIRSTKEIYDYLKRKKYEEIDILNTIDKLTKNGYLNDKEYAKCYIKDRINTSNDGINKIKKHLDESNILYKDYCDYLDLYTNDIQINKINDYINKKLKTNKSSLNVFKNKMLVNLINLGYNKDIINSCLNKINLDNEDELREIEKEKIKRKLEKKYSGKELEYKIKEKLYQKGFF